VESGERGRLSVEMAQAVGPLLRELLDLFGTRLGEADELAVARALQRAFVAGGCAAGALWELPWAEQPEAGDTAT
jgi:hypothetical protein